MNFMCLMHGHALPVGYGETPPYLEAEGGHIDGIGREHWRLFAKCRRCDERYQVANVHGPLLAKLGESA